MNVLNQKFSKSLSKEVVKPSSRRHMDKKAVLDYKIPIKRACILFSISETCCRYESNLNHEKNVIADCLWGLTLSQRNWGFGLTIMKGLIWQ
jgi:putative transposase